MNEVKNEQEKICEYFRNKWHFTESQILQIEGKSSSFLKEKIDLVEWLIKNKPKKANNFEAYLFKAIINDWTDSDYENSKKVSDNPKKSKYRPMTKDEYEIIITRKREERAEIKKDNKIFFQILLKVLTKEELNENERTYWKQIKSSQEY